MSSAEIPADEWDEVPATTEARTKYLQSKGVPIDDDGCYMPNFVGMEGALRGDKRIWVYHWNDVCAVFHTPTDKPCGWNCIHDCSREKYKNPCENANPSAMCANCDCWKATRARCG